MRSIPLTMLLLTFLVGYILYRTHDSERFNKLAVQAIVGEASNQSEDTMICIAHAIRNRGTLHGVYGVNAPHIWRESRTTWREAQIAWDISALESDPVQGAENFGTIEDLRKTAKKEDSVFWANYRTKCGDFYFY